MTYQTGFVLLWALLLTTMAGISQGNPPVDLPGMVVSGEWLQSRLGNPGLVILHVGGDSDYDQGHLPGALLLKLSDISVTSESGLRLELPAPEALARTLGAMGISNQHRVVIYHGTESVQSATRVWFTFDYLGLGQQAVMLDGGLALWRREGRPMSTNAATPPAASLMVSPRQEVVASLDWMRSQHFTESQRLVDARLPQFYSGAEMGIASRAGHIPHAVSIPYPSFFDEAGRWMQPDALRDLLVRNQESPALLVTYCHIGQQATVPYFAARLLGLNVKMFDGSFQAWSREEVLPVEKVP